MKSRKQLRQVVWGCFCILLAATGSWAELSEPDHIIYGSASLNGETVAQGSSISLVLDEGAATVARYSMGSDLEMGDLYVLRVPLDAIGDRSAGTARTGDPGSILIDGEVAGQVLIGERGTVQKMDVDPDNIEATPSLSIDDVSVAETDAGTFELVFTVSLSPFSEDEVTTDWVTDDGSAVGGGICGAGIDYIADSGMVTIAPGDSQAFITILACGEVEMEADETFFVDLLNPSNAVLLDPQGRGTIIDDDTPPQLSINNVTITEPQTGSLSAFFRVSASRLWEEDVSFSFSTSDGTANAGPDYLSTSGTGTIPGGSLETTVEVEILSDTLNEEDETFFVDLSSPVNASILDGNGQGIIVDAAQFLMWLETQVDGVSIVDGLAGAYSSAVSPDGLHVYVTGSADNALALFNRAPADGALTFIQTYTANDFTGRAITTFIGLSGPEAVIVSDDGLNVYVAAFADDAITVFSRDPVDGSLTLLEVEINGSNDLGDPGDPVAGLDGPNALAMSPSHPDGQHLYASAYNSGSVAVFQRDPIDGSLSFWESETDGVDDPSDLGGMVDGLHFATDIVVSGDGINVYVTGQGDDAVAVFERDADPNSGTIGRLSFLEVEKDGAGGVEGLAAATALSITPDGDHLYVAGQSDNAVAIFSRDISGLLDWAGVATHGVDGVEGLLGASGVTVSQDGRYVYSCGYLSDAVTVFERDMDDLGPSYGSLEYIEVKNDGVGGVDGLFRPTSLTVSPGDGNVYVTGYSDNAVAVFHRDLTPPTNPTLASTTHLVSQWSNMAVVGMGWSGADDPSGSGVAGYSFLFDIEALTDADEALDLAHTVDPHATSSTALADGIEHYFHLRTCDHSNNCSTTINVGPYWIDTIAPEDVVITTSSHVVGVPSYDDTIQMGWTDPPTDPGVTPSGVFGYSYNFNENPVGECNFEVDALVGTENATSVELKSGLWYFHICAVDNAGNWSTPSTDGPFEIINDTIPPKVIDLSTVSLASMVDPELGYSGAHGITQFLLTFSKQMFDPVDDIDPNDVSNPANYQLVHVGPDGLFNTDACGSVGGDDVLIPVEGAVYNSSTTTAALFVGEGTSLPMGWYRTFGCAAVGLEDINHNPLDGDADGVGGDDFVFTFLMERTNMLLNPNLDEPNLAPEWTLSNSVLVTHSTDDADSAETSGSIRIHRDTGVGDDHEFSVSQCVAMPAWDESDFHLSAVVRVNETLGGDPGVAGSFAGVTYFDAPNCSGASLGPEELTNVVLDDTLGAWLPIDTDLGPAPVAALSALVSLAVQIPLAEDFPFDAWFDNVLFQFSDTAPPVDPTVQSTTHVAGMWTQLSEVNMTWDGATDAGVGVAGYSFEFDTVPATVPDDTLDIEHVGGVHGTSSGTLADGQWFFHLRSCDYVANCTSAVHEGWYGIDTVPPANPTAIVSTSHTLGLESIDSVIEISWTPATDSPPAPSGVVGYAVAFNNNTSGTCNQVMNFGGGETTLNSEPLINGDWYFHVCTVDLAGNWSSPTTIGPFVINDDVSPTILSLDTVSSTPDGTLDWAETTSLPITQLLVKFSEPLNDPAGDFEPDDVSNPQNYRLVEAGIDGTPDTIDCSSILNDDNLMVIDFVVWDLDTRVATIGVGTGSALPGGIYSLFACGSTTITDVAGNALDGDANGTGGDDFVWAFQILGTNLVENPNFDGNYIPWIPTDAPPAFFAFNTEDVDDAETSGSALITGVAGSDLIIGLSQCIDVSTLDVVLGLSGRVLLTNNSTPDPVAYGIVTFYDGAGCAGTEVGELSTAVVVGDTGGGWAEIPGANSLRPTGAVSALVSFAGTGGNDPGADFDAAFDSLVFRDVPEALFFDGFESGDSTPWISN